MESVVAMERERELQGLQIEMRLGFNKPNAADSSAPARPEYRHQAPRELRPRRGWFAQVLKLFEPEHRAGTQLLGILTAVIVPDRARPSH